MRFWRNIPENNKTADATYMKGMALLKSGQRNEAAREFLERDHEISEFGSRAESADTAQGSGVERSRRSTRERRRAPVIRCGLRLRLLPVP